MHDRDRQLSASATVLTSKFAAKNGSAGGSAPPQPKMGLVRRTMSFQFGRKKTDQIDPNTMAFVRVRYKDVSKAVIWPEYAGQSIKKPNAMPLLSPDKSAIQYHSSGNHQPAVTLRLNGNNLPRDIRKSVLKANATAKARKPIDAISMSEEGVHTGSSIFYAHAYDITNAAEMQTTNGSTATKPRAAKHRQKTAGGDAVSNASSTSIDPQREQQSPSPDKPNVPPRSVDDYTAGPNPIFEADIEDEKSPYLPAMINSVRRSESESSSDSVVQITRL